MRVVRGLKKVARVLVDIRLLTLQAERFLRVFRDKLWQRATTDFQNYRCECAGLMDVGRFGAMAKHGRNIVAHNRNFYKRATTSIVRKWQSMLLSRNAVCTERASVILFSLIAKCDWCKNGCFKWRAGAMALALWQGLYSSVLHQLLYSSKENELIWGLSKDGCAQPSVCGVAQFGKTLCSQNDPYCHYASVAAFWQIQKAHRLSNLPTHQMFTYLSCASGDKALQFEFLLQRTATTDFWIISFVCIIWAAE